MAEFDLKFVVNLNSYFLSRKHPLHNHDELNGDYNENDDDVVIVFDDEGW